MKNRTEHQPITLTKQSLKADLAAIQTFVSSWNMDISLFRPQVNFDRLMLLFKHFANIYAEELLKNGYTVIKIGLYEIPIESADSDMPKKVLDASTFRIPPVRVAKC